MLLIFVCVEVVLTGRNDQDGFGTAHCPCPCHKQLSASSSTTSRSMSLQHCQSCALKVSSTASEHHLLHFLMDSPSCMIVVNSDQSSIIGSWFWRTLWPSYILSYSERVQNVICELIYWQILIQPHDVSFIWQVNLVNFYELIVHIISTVTF